MTTAEILIVDDDPTSITALKNALAGLGRLCFATHGSEALRMVQRRVAGLLLPDTDAEGAEKVARRLLAAADALALPHGASPDRACVSWSIGVACSIQLRQDLQANPLGTHPLVDAADRALCEAKRRGRARFSLAQP